MIILLKNNLNCDKVCKVINEYLSRELKNLKGVKDLSNYALTFNLTEIKDHKEIKLIEK